MRTGIKILLAMVVVLGVIATVTFVNRAPATSQELVAEVTRETHPVKVVRVKAETLVQRMERTGVLRANMDVVMTAQVAGQVVKVAGELGDHCKKDQVLFRLDAEGYRIALAQANGAFKQARAMLDQAERTRDRLRKLQERQVATEQDLDSAETGYLAAKAALDQATAGLRLAQKNLRETGVKCPFDGQLA